MLVVITQHEGRYSRNGGEYGFWMELWRDGHSSIRKKYRTTSEFPYCVVIGRFQDCWNCPDYDAGSCTADYEAVQEEELQWISKATGVPVERLIALIDSDEMYRVDATGHNYTPCRHEGGCTICWPCNHSGC